MDGALAKLTITPFEDSETVQAGTPAGEDFVAQFNPESFTVDNAIELGPDEPAQGDNGQEAKFKSIKPRTFTFDFLLDGTGATGEKKSVLDSIDHFKETVGFSGKIHRPRFLVLSWGTFIATSVLESYSVNYKLFQPDGTPLRAVLSATFREHKSNEAKERESNKSSPDVVHSHRVVAGDHLVRITHGVYRSPRHYLHVAEFNRLDTVRAVETGRTLYLPPLV